METSKLQNAAALVGYEVQMLCVSLVAATGGQFVLSGGMKNLVLESFLLHYRVLRDFLYPKNQANPDDIIAAHYVAAWSFTDTEWKEIVKDERKRLNKALAHLSYERAGGPPFLAGAHSLLPHKS